MKKTLLLSSALAMATAVNAQMPDNRIAPNWTGTDLDGVSHTLYDYLDQGYTVFIDVSATWCQPCWNYHNTEALRTLFDTHGPGTADDKAMVFFVEGDGQTTLADLNGTGPNTQGNWVTATTYPIIDDSDIADLLEIGYFPTIYRICPNRLITEVGAISASALWTSCQGCEKYLADSPTDASVLPNIGSDVVCMGSPVDLSIRLQNTGTTPLTSATIEAKRGTTVLGTSEWTGNLATYELETVNVTSFNPTAASNAITYTILTTDDLASNNTAAGSITADNSVMPEIEVQLELKTDDYPNETTWKLFDGAGEIVAQDPATAYAAATVYTYDWTLNDNECYRFEIYDGAGDGLCCDYGTGYFRLKANGVNILTGGAFDNIDVEPFKTSIASAVEENVLESGLSIFPNPTNGVLNVNLNLSGATTVNISVMNMLGEVVYQNSKNFGAGAQQTALDLSDIAQGSYVMNVLADGMTATRKVTITH